MRIPLGPLNEAETLKLAELLEHVAGRSLVFARGLFAAAASAPVLLDPTEWMPLLLTQAPPDRTSLERLFELLIREYNACAECLSLGVPVVPHPEAAEEEITEFCRGYVQLMQSVTRWTRDANAFPLSVPFAVMAGYVGPEALRSSDPSAEQDFDAWRVRRSKSLPDDVAELFGYWAEARKKAAPEVKEAPPAVVKIGRNDACPCGSGKKYKKCCAS